MIKSKFSYRTYFYVVVTIVTFILPITLFIDRVEAFGSDYNLKFLYIAFLMWFACFWLVSGTIKGVVSINFDDEVILIKNIFLIEKQSRLKDFGGYETTFETSRGGTYEVLYLMKNKKTLVHISEFHFSNYKELKSLIEKKLNNLGYIPFNYFTDWRRYK